MKTYYVELYHFNRNEKARFVVKASDRGEAENKVKDEFSKPESWRIENITLINFDYSDVIEL